MKKIIFIAIAVLICALVGCGGLYYFGAFGSHLVLTKTTFNHLPNWKQDNQEQALQAFIKSCKIIEKRSPQKPFSTLAHSGTIKDWQSICKAAKQVDKPTSLTARQFFEYWFEPYHVGNNYNYNGLFTGYYLPLLQVSLSPTERYTVPIYALPKDLIKVDVDVSQPGSMKQTKIGQLKNNRLYPYPERAAISKGAIDKNTDVLFWSDDAIDVYFAQIQGSAIVELDNKKRFTINYAGANGHPYTSLGKILIEKKELSPEAVSMQTIRTWLLQNPNQAETVLNQNASYVFFRILDDPNPLGAQQVPLTPERTLAVDLRYLPLGAPIWLSTDIPQEGPEISYIPFQRLMVAQDTGGAIRGAVRGDVYWGAGEKAVFTAGHMKSSGQYWVLLPKRR